MRWPLFLPPPHPIPGLTSLSLNEILSLFCPDPAEFVLMGGNRAPLEAEKKQKRLLHKPETKVRLKYYISLVII